MFTKLATPLFAKIGVGIIGVSLLGMVVLSLLLAGEKIHSAKLQTALITCNKTLENERQQVRDKTAVAKADDAAHAAKVEAHDTKIQMENNDAIRDRIGRARTALSLRNQPAAPARSGGEAPVSSPPQPPSSADGAGGASELSAADKLICVTNTLKAEGWQDWQKAVASIPE